MRIAETLRVVADVQADVGEGPCWDERGNRLLFVDVTPGLVYSYSPASGLCSPTAVGQEVSAVIPRSAGGHIAAVRDGIVAFDLDTGASEVIAPIEHDRPTCRMNEAKCDPSGRLWAGTMAFDFSAGAASLYRVEADGQFEQVLDGITISNGLGWSLPADLMYYIDSADYSIDVFDFDLDSGEIENRRTFVGFDATEGLPDGLAVDAEGHVWVALFGGGCVRRYTPDGELAGEIPLPVKQVTSVAFGGAALDELYITTAAYQLAGPQLAGQPLAGATFVCSPGVAGLPTNLFAG